MSVVAVFVSSSVISFCRLSLFFYQSRSLSQTIRNFREIIMSNLSIESISSCEIAGSNYGMLKPKSPDLSQKSEVICNFPFNEAVQPGFCFVISGVILKTCERFSINLLSSGHKQDIALHLNPRLPQNYIVRNSKINGSWGTEETCSQFSSHYNLFRGHKFSIEILITESEFMLSINNTHFGSFAHRVPYRKINCIEVKGDVKEVAIDRLFREKYPEVPIKDIIYQDSLDDENLVVPYISNIPGGFTKNKSIHIFGRVKLLPHSITINLQHTPFFWPHATIALHINPRFSGGKHIICRNTWKNGRWMKEERTDISFRDLSPGKEFKMTIHCDFESYHIYLNDQFFADYQFRCDDNATKIVDTLNISGDIVLKKVFLETKTFD